MMNRVWLCAIAKLENVYLREWVEHYKDLGFEHIVLCDNNDIDGERFEEVIDDYIESGFVIVRDFRGKKRCQGEAYFRTYYKYIEQFDWMAFFDIDEFLFIDSGKKIYEEIDRYKHFVCIRVCWQNYDDNGLIKVENNNYSVKRFTHSIEGDNQSKSILKSGLNLNYLGAHGYNNSINTCNSEGEKCNVNKNGGHNKIDKITLNIMHLNHYRLKTIEEFLKFKAVRGDMCNSSKNSTNFFWAFNKKTDEKEEYVKSINDNNKIVVSIICITYNHKNYIKQCIDSFLSQKTDFKYEILIHDDCSTDGTKEIIEEYVEKHPDIIVPFYETQNIFLKEKSTFKFSYNLIKKSKGKYIAFCEGDDYWIDDFKLQKQVDFLENNKDVVLCSTKYIEYDKKGNTYKECLTEIFKDKYVYNYSKENYLKKWYVKTNSILYRKKEGSLTYDKMAKYSNNRDCKFFYELFSFGNFAVLNFFGSVYRIHENGIFSSLNNEEKLKTYIENYEEIFKFHPDDLLLKNKILNYKKQLDKISK